jgi:ABC-type bacteriocin/lantibiotic exporter with double-glycine peptidase domain
MTLVQTGKNRFVSNVGRSVKEALKYFSITIVSGAIFAIGLAVLVTIYALWVIVGVAFVAIPAMLGILTMEFRQIRPCLPDVGTILDQTKYWNARQ